MLGIIKPYKDAALAVQVSQVIIVDRISTEFDRLIPPPSGFSFAKSVTISGSRLSVLHGWQSKLSTVFAVTHRQKHPHEV